MPSSWLDRVEPWARRWTRPLLWLLIIVPLVWVVARGVLGHLGADPIERVEDETGRWALRLLAASLAITPLFSITRWGWLVRERRFLGLSAFYAAALHVSVYIGLDNFFDIDDIIKDVVKHLWVTVGMAAFLMLLTLAITSTKGWVRRLGGRRWKQLHRIVYVAAVAGCIHFLWSVKKDITEPVIYSSAFALLFVARLVIPKRVGAARAV